MGKTFGSSPMLLAKPLTFMNLSGQAVQALASFHKVDAADLLVVADDVNLPLGRLRARRGGSAGGHNGFKSVAEQLGTDQFPRLRVGVGGGEPGRDLAGHVLGRFSADERQAILDAVNRAADAVEAVRRRGDRGRDEQVQRGSGIGPREVAGGGLRQHVGQSGLTLTPCLRQRQTARDRRPFSGIAVVPRGSNVQKEPQ